MAGSPGPDILAQLDQTAAALIERAAPATIRLAGGAADVAIAQRLRGAAVIARGWLHPDALPDGREEDADDDRAVHLLAFRGDTPVGTCRLLYPAADATGWAWDAPFLGRIAVVDPQGRAQRAIASALIGRAWLEIRAKGYCRIAGLTSVPMLRLLRRMGFVVRVVGPPVRSFGEDRVPMLFEPGPLSDSAPNARTAPSRPR